MYKNILMNLIFLVFLFVFASCSSLSSRKEDPIKEMTKYFHIDSTSADDDYIYVVFTEDNSKFPTAISSCSDVTEAGLADAYVKIVLEGTTLKSGEVMLSEVAGYCSISVAFNGDKVVFYLSDKEVSLNYLYDQTGETFTVMIAREGEEEPEADSCPSYGVAGSCIFYDKGEETFGWRYLEVAPSSTMAMKTWDAELPFEETSAVDQSIGMGKEMTGMIISTLGASNTYAAGYCDSLEVEKDGVTYDDWFLPSTLELELMYTNLHREGYGNFNLCGYWSSSENDMAPDQAYHISFISGGTGVSQDKSNEHCVRCVRFAN